MTFFIFALEMINLYNHKLGTLVMNSCENPALGTISINKLRILLRLQLLE